MDFSFLKDVLFYGNAVIMVACAIATVLVKNVLHSAVALIATFFCTAILYFLLSAEFIAVAQIMVYIGGVVVFIVFAILLTSRLGEESLPVSLSRKVFATFFSLLFVFTSVLLIRGAGLKNLPQMSEQDLPDSQSFASLSIIGKRLLSPESDGFLLPFEAISLLLLISLIGAATIARKPHEDKNPREK